MKKIVLLAGLAFSLGTGFTSQAQVRINVQIGSPVVQQPWYSNDNDYYYMPEQGVYYNVRRKVYVYPESGRWYTANRLPSRYGNVNYRSGNYVRVRDRSPFDRDNEYRQRYNRSANSNGSRGNNPHDNGRHDNGNHNGWNHDNGHRNSQNHQENSGYRRD